MFTVTFENNLHILVSNNIYQHICKAGLYGGV